MITALLLALSGGCNASGPNEGLLSRVTVDRIRLERGESVTITVSVFSGAGGGTPVGSSSCPTGYTVLDRAGAAVAPLDVVCTADLSPIRIPEKGLVRQFIWRGRSGLEDGGSPLPAGVYRIIGGPGPPGATPAAASNAVAIELVEP